MTQEVLCDGWYITGDIGYRDERGFYYVIDRKQNMIISGGENIYPQEIETFIKELGDEIVDVVVLGVPDKIWGESVHAVIEIGKDSNLSTDEIKEHCRKGLSSYKKPKEILLWEELPRNVSGKVDRAKTLETILSDKNRIREKGAAGEQRLRSEQGIRWR